MNDKIKNTDFLNDEEKMRDFICLTKEEFLASYSYITEDEYDNTYNRYYARELANVLREFAEKPQNIDNFENYLENHFIAWERTFANTPKKMIGDMKHFSEMEIIDIVKKGGVNSGL